MLIALYEPDIPQNTGSMIRLCACLNLPLHIIEPCGYPFDDKRMRRVALDYYDLVAITRHTSWNAFENWREISGGRLLLLTTKAKENYTQFAYRSDDILLFGRESSGVPKEVSERADAGLRIPLNPKTRSLNIVQAASMVAGEALRQTNGFI